MAFSIPDVAAAWNPIQARIQSGDIQILTDGINGVGVASGCAVTAQGSPNMTVAVASGTARIGGSNVSVSSGNVTITANATGNPRIDLICVNDAGTKSAQAGTAAASPKYPTIPATSAVLAAVLVPTGTSSITSNNIVDKRAVVSSTTGLVAANNLSDVLSASTSRTNLGLGTIATQAASSVTITGGSITGITDLAVADGGTGGSTAAAARTNLDAAQTAHNHAASDVTSGTMATARLGSGSASSSTYLRGDQTWASVAGGTSSITNVRIAGGLVGDGTTDDSTALQAVIDASTSGDTLFFDRMFGIDTAIKFKEGRKYLGSNKETTGLRQINGSNLDYLACDEGWFNNDTTASDPWTIEDMCFDVNKAGQSSGTGIGLICMNFWALHRSCLFENYTDAGIKVTTQNRNAVTISNQVSEPRFWECQFRGNGTGQGIWQHDPSLSKCADGWVIGCAFAGGQRGLYLAACAGWIIQANHFYAQRKDAIYGVGAYATIVNGNYMEGWGYDLTTVTEKWAIGLEFANGPWPSTITGNVCTGPGPSGGGTQLGYARGIQFYGVSGAAAKCTITGNSVFGNTDANSTGIWVHAAGGGGRVAGGAHNTNWVKGWATPFVVNAAVDMHSFPVGGTWAAATGTPTRTTFATGSVTLPQLAERVKALIDDLYTTKGLLD